MTLRDLTCIEDSHQDWLEGSTAHINVKKLRMVGQVLLEVAHLQAYPINYSILYSASPVILSAIRSEIGVPVPENCDDLLHDLSCELLPAKST